MPVCVWDGRLDQFSRDSARMLPLVLKESEETLLRSSGALMRGLLAVLALIFYFSSADPSVGFDIKDCYKSVEQSGLTDPQKTKKNLICTLKNDRDNYYAYWSDIFGFMFVFVTVFVAAGSAASSYLIAINFAADSSTRRAFLAAIPAVVGLFASLSSQFGLYDLWKLREFGRIKTQSMIDRLDVVYANTDEEMEMKLQQFFIDRNNLSEEQAKGFYTSISSQRNGDGG